MPLWGMSCVWLIDKLFNSLTNMLYYIVWIPMPTLLWLCSRCKSLNCTMSLFNLTGLQAKLQNHIKSATHHQLPPLHRPPLLHPRHPIHRPYWTTPTALNLPCSLCFVQLLLLPIAMMLKVWRLWNHPYTISSLNGHPLSPISIITTLLPAIQHDYYWQTQTNNHHHGRHHKSAPIPLYTDTHTPMRREREKIDLYILYTQPFPPFTQPSIAL